MKIYKIILINLVLFSHQINAENFKFDKKYWEWELKKWYKKGALEGYLNLNKEGFNALVNDSNGEGKIPELMFRVFPKLFPEVWGNEKDNFKTPGMNKNPYSDRVHIPLGMARALEKVELKSGKTLKIHKIGFNCVSCHASQVEIKEGEYQYLIGAPNPRIDNLFFMMAKTFIRPDFNLENIRKAIKEIPKKEFKNNFLSTEEFDLFVNNENTEDANKIISDLKVFAQKILGGFTHYIKPRMYSSKNAPDPLSTKRGSHDALLGTYTAYVKYVLENFPPEKAKEMLDSTIPKTAAEIDSPAIWKQKGRGKFTHWDGGLPEVFHRNVGAAAAAHSKPMNLKNLELVTNFLDYLPSPPYPFRVNMKMARKGKKHFRKHCIKCHQAKVQVFDVAEVGTSPERFNHMNDNSRGFLGLLLLSLCSPENSKEDQFSAMCLKKAPDVPYSPNELVQKTDGYIADDLTGIWARSPYLHNGSVPTLYHLLVPNERPRQFYKGAFKYDEKLVGYK